VLTRQSVYIPEGNFSPWGEQSRGADISLGLVSVRRASRCGGGTWTSGWYVNTYKKTDKHRPPGEKKTHGFIFMGSLDL